MDLILRLNIDDFARSLRRLGDQMPALSTRALNRSILSARTIMARQIAADTGLKVGRVRDRYLTVLKASHSRPVARLSASLRRVPLIEFGAKGPEPSRGKGRGVTAKLRGGSRRYPHAFIATMRSGHRGVFQRTRATNRWTPTMTMAQEAAAQRDGGRLPIRELRGPSIGRVFMKHLPRAQARFNEQLTKNFAHEMRFALSKLG